MLAGALVYPTSLMAEFLEKLFAMGRGFFPLAISGALIRWALIQCQRLYGTVQTYLVSVCEHTCVRVHILAPVCTRRLEV